MTMNEEQPQREAQQQAVEQAGPGSMLRQAREARGWSQNEVARRLNLRVAVIESIDDDHYKAGVALTFLRGYVKAYAKLVGISEQQALAAFDGMDGIEQMRSAGSVPMQSFSKKTRQQASDKWLKRISWLVLLGLLVSLVFWWWQNSGVGYVAGEAGTEQSMPAEPVPAAADTAVPSSEITEVAAPSGEELPAVVPTEVTAPETAPAGMAETTDAGEAPTEPVQAEAAEAEPEPTPVPAADPELLVLGFNADCWIKITDANGRVLAEGVKTAADRLELKGTPPFRLVLGAPQAASVEYLNQAVDLSSFRAGRVARLTVPQS